MVLLLTNTVVQGTDRSSSDASTTSNSAAEAAAGLRSDQSSFCLAEIQEKQDDGLPLDVDDSEVGEKAGELCLDALQSVSHLSGADRDLSASHQPINV
jgi:hypothetical protein